MEAKATEIFYLVDEFCNEFYKVKQGHVLPKTTAKKTRNRKFILSDNEVITKCFAVLNFDISKPVSEISVKIVEAPTPLISSNSTPPLI